ncbi:3-oxo-5-alpha-steroid 4-dehydrogenase 1-like [Corticium candelabrum]|uniref:3-oxo-5-alpha-steroid 4-dehydrogenase 1-like n=1 Tax=Corticium candelabrum TaxID=121492 RepID=UPI002E261C5E|nr:3-oxo-5-alpha-steroid 4-dehydrogenase 1-like [Corticium candelabrum]
MVNSTSAPLFQWLPWRFSNDAVHIWTQYSLVIAGFVLAVVTLLSQLKKPAPYGRHQKEDSGWGPLIPQRIAHTISDFSALFTFTLVFFLVGSSRSKGYCNYVFLTLWLLHYVHRALIHPWIMRYSSRSVPVGIALGTVLPNLLYPGTNGDWTGTAVYDDNYYYDPRFIIGIVLYIIGYVINKHADLKLRSLRNRGGSSYSIPRGGLFEYISCPNYFGELLEWLGWTIATWSLAGLVWLLFTMATFIPRARHNHQWYQHLFEDYPSQRKALIPCVY